MQKSSFTYLLQVSAHVEVTLTQNDNSEAQNAKVVLILIIVIVIITEKTWVYWSPRPYLPCVTKLMTDGCEHLLYNSSWKFHQLAAGQLLLGQPVRYGKGRLLSITYKITPAGSLSSSRPGGPPCWASPRAFGLIGHNACSIQWTEITNTNNSPIRPAIILELQDLNIIKGGFFGF